MSTPSLSKKQLALQYFPDITPQGAVHKLMDFVNRDEELLCAIRHTGYRDRQKRFTSRQVGIIYGYLGDPRTA